MRTVPVVEAKSHFSALLGEVEAGEEIAITRHGRVVARLVPDTPRTAAEVFRRLGGADMDLDPPTDMAPEPVATLD